MKRDAVTSGEKLFVQTAVEMKNQLSRYSRLPYILDKMLSLYVSAKVGHILYVFVRINISTWSQPRLTKANQLLFVPNSTLTATETLKLTMC